MQFKRGITQNLWVGYNSEDPDMSCPNAGPASKVDVFK